MVRVAGVAPWWPCASTLLVPNWWPRANARLLLTLHPEKWLPDLDSHQDKRLNRPPCYFDTTWQMALPTGFPPASFRLEDGCLMYSTTAAFEIGRLGIYVKTPCALKTSPGNVGTLHRTGLIFLDLLQQARFDLPKALLAT